MNPNPPRHAAGRRVYALLGAFCLALKTAGAAADLPRSMPEAQGVDSARVLALVDALDRRIHSVHSVMLLRHGQVVAEGWWSPYQSRDIHILYSITKTFVSTAVGFAAQEGRLSVNDKVLSFFPDLAPAQPAPQMENMRIRDLLRMSTGHERDSNPGMHAAPGGAWTRAFLSLPVEFKPGTHFVYDSGGAYMLSAILQRVTGMTVEAYLDSRLFRPLGIEHRSWGRSPEGVDLGDGGLSLRTEDLAKFGQWYLQKGMWAGRRLLSEQWIEAASSLQTSNGSDPEGNWDQGYGYLIWLNKGGGYRADGALGQFCFVFPGYDAVLAVTSGTADLAGVMDTVWSFLPPALHYVALAPNPAAQAALAHKLSSLALPVQAGDAHVPGETSRSRRVFRLQPNERGLRSVVADFSGASPVLKIEDADGRHTIVCGLGQWTRARTDFYPRISDMWSQKDSGIAVCAAWTDPDTFVSQLCFDETPYVVTLAFHYSPQGLTLTYDNPLRWEKALRHLKIRGTPE